MTSPNDTSSTETFGIDRRDVLKLAGGAVVGVAAFAGPASASSAQFLGCSGVCGADEDAAVVLANDGYECRTLDKQDDEQAVTRDEASELGFDAEVYACYEAADDEAIIGVLHYERDEETDERVCGLCLNPNDRAPEYYESEEEILSELDCGGCEDVRGDCMGTVYDSNGERRTDAGTTEGD